MTNRQAYFVLGLAFGGFVVFLLMLFGKMDYYGD